MEAGVDGQIRMASQGDGANQQWLFVPVELLERYKFVHELAGVSLSLGLIITILEISKAASNLTSLEISTFYRGQSRNVRE